MSKQEIDVLQDLPEPKDFFERYVTLRKPVVLRNCSFVKVSLGDVRQRVAPDAVVEVNVLSSQGNATFSPQGSAPLRIPFSEFMEKLESGRYYLTTQELGVDDEGRPQLFASPVTELVGMFPLRPKLLGGLLPMTYNLWIGHKNGENEAVSSGLHHDFHDNLYCLLQGKKRFRVSPPDCVHKHTMKGSLHTLHDNGRIVYHEQIEEGMIRPDGALESVEEMVCLEIRKEEIERKIEACEDDEKKVELEAELDQVEESILDYEMRGGDDQESDAEEETDQPQNGSPDGPTTKKSRIERLPLNFVVNESREAAHCQVDLSQGDMFYLPAGWFHEVSSFGGTHMAFNYWVHPPDTEQTFEKPYRSEFWPRDWAARTELHKEAD